MSDTLLNILRQELQHSITNAVNDAFEKNKHHFLPNTDGDVLSLKEAAALIKKSPKTLYRLVSKREIPFAKQGRGLVFFKPELLGWLKSHQVKSVFEIEADAEANLLLTTKKSRRCRSQ